MKRYEYLKMQHRCVRCGGRDAYTLGGRAVCSDCCEQRRTADREYYRAHADEKNQKAKDLRAERTSAGLCPTCGKRAPVQGKRYCERCLARWRRNQDERKRRCEEYE